jgi:hypothetical protein
MSRIIDQQVIASAGGAALEVACQAAGAHQVGGWVGRAVRCLPVQVLFRAASRRTGHDGFPVIRLSSDYGVSDSDGSRRTHSTVSAICISHTSRV